MEETPRQADSVREGVSAEDPLLRHYAEVGRSFLQDRRIDVAETARELDNLFERTIHSLYLAPVLKRVKDAGVNTALGTSDDMGYLKHRWG